MRLQLYTSFLVVKPVLLQSLAQSFTLVSSGEDRATMLKYVATHLRSALFGPVSADNEKNSKALIEVKLHSKRVKKMLNYTRNE